MSDHGARADDGSRADLDPVEHDHRVAEPAIVLDSDPAPADALFVDRTGGIRERMVLCQKLNERAHRHVPADVDPTPGAEDRVRADVRVIPHAEADTRIGQLARHLDPGELAHSYVVTKSDAPTPVAVHEDVVADGHVPANPQSAWKEDVGLAADEQPAGALTQAQPKTQTSEVGPEALPIAVIDDVAEARPITITGDRRNASRIDPEQPNVEPGGERRT